MFPENSKRPQHWGQAAALLRAVCEWTCPPEVLARLAAWVRPQDYPDTALSQLLDPLNTIVKHSLTRFVDLVKRGSQCWEPSRASVLRWRLGRPCLARCQSAAKFVEPAFFQRFHAWSHLAQVPRIDKPEDYETYTIDIPEVKVLAKRYDASNAFKLGRILSRDLLHSWASPGEHTTLQGRTGRERASRHPLQRRPV